MDRITIDGVVFEGVRVETPRSVLLMIVAPEGFLGCGWFSTETADKLSEAAAVVTGVRTYDDMLEARVVRRSQAAEEMGVEVGMSGRDALKKLAGA